MQDSKTYLNVPFAQKDAAKALGAKWDPKKKQWYVPASLDITEFAQWQTQSGTAKSPATKSKANSRISSKNVILGVTTYGKHKDMMVHTGDAPPWDE